MRWALRLAECTYSVEHKPCEKHTNADGLSRAMCAAICKDELPVIDLATLREHQNNDPHYQELKKSKNFKMSTQKILYRVNGAKKSLVVTINITSEVIREVIIQGRIKVGETFPPDLKPHLRKMKLSVLAGAPLSDLFLI
ncbi:hypothetical protein J6590_073791 [Homalodisca vitripennis]|nr:hypothetical protein J6590_073791 [Homalodisca vitripennis]